MSLLAFHAALRTTLNPYNPTDPVSIVRTVNLALDDPDNSGIGSFLSGVQIRHSLIPDYQLVETVGRFSPRNRRLKGNGMRMSWDIEATCFHGDTPADLSTTEAQLRGLLTDLGIGMTGHQDGVSTYLWFTPNYRWGNPKEQWVLVVPKAGAGIMETDPKPWGTVLKLAVETDRNYKSISWVERRRGFRGVGAGTITVVATSVVGVGTSFLADFIPGDKLLDAAGNPLGGTPQTVTAVISDTQMVVSPGVFLVYGGGYQFQQVSAPSFLVPIYTFTEFEASRGWGVTPWGEDWGSPTP